MTTHDAINAIFEGGGALFLCLNVRRLLKDKSVKGVSLLTTSWWTAWGFWNVYFYAAVSCSASFWAGIAVVLANAVWLCLAVYYSTADERAARRQFKAAMGGRPEPPYEEPDHQKETRAYFLGARGVPSPGCRACTDKCACPTCWEKQGRP